MSRNDTAKSILLVLIEIYKLWKFDMTMTRKVCGYVQELVLYMKTSRHDQENAYGYVFCNMTAILLRPQYVNIIF